MANNLPNMAGFRDPDLGGEGGPALLASIEAEHRQRMEYARIEHERRMQVIEDEAALVEERRRELANSRQVHDYPRGLDERLRRWRQGVEAMRSIADETDTEEIWAGVMKNLGVEDKPATGEDD